MPSTTSIQRGLLWLLAAFAAASMIYLAWPKSIPDAVERAELSQFNPHRTAPVLKGPDTGRSPHSDVVTPEHGASGTLHFLSMADLKPASGSAWGIAASDMHERLEEEREYVADSQGLLRIPEGEWTLHSADGTWIPMSPQIRTTRGAAQVVWVQRRQVLQFLVTTASGQPINGVLAIWIPPGTDQRRDSDSPSINSTSDESGRVVLEDCPCDLGLAVFLHPDYERQEVSICGPPAGTVRVVLHPALAGRRLTFTRLGEGGEVRDVVLSSMLGYEIARCAPGSSSVVVPAWVAPGEALLTASPTTHPCLLTLTKLASDEVALPGRRQAAITVDSSARCPGMVTIETWIGDISGLSVEVIRPNVVRAESGVVAIIDVPSHVRIGVRASDPCGGFEQADLTADDPAPRSHLLLGPAESLALRAVDKSGRLVRSARAATQFGGKFVQNSSGLIRIPLALGLNSFTVEADGYASVVVSRGLVEAAPQGEQFTTIVLELEVDAVFVVRSTDDSALPGMRVSVWSTGRAERTGESGPWVADLAVGSVSGVTDAAGRFHARGLRAGEAEVEVDLPPELGTDPYSRFPYPSQVSRHVLVHGGEYQLTAPRPMLLALHVVNGATAEPVRAFELRGEGAGMPTLEVRGSYWQGWCSSDVREMTVAVQGLGEAIVDVTHATPNEALRVPVLPGPQIRLRIVGMPRAPEGTEVLVQVMRATTNGLRLERTIKAHLDALGETVLELGDVPGAWIGVVGMRVGPTSIEFEPEFQSVQSGGVAHFRCVY